MKTLSKYKTAEGRYNRLYMYDIPAKYYMSGIKKDCMYGNNYCLMYLDENKRGTKKLIKLLRGAELKFELISIGLSECKIYINLDK